MSEDFYRSIAKRLLGFLETTELKHGMRFWLRLDNQSQIEGISLQVKAAIAATGKLESYIYRDPYGKNIYETFAIHLNEIRIVFVPQFSDMEADFLATLRNAARNEGFVFVGLTADKLDTVDSATQRLDAPGMPFSEEALRKDVEHLIASSSYPAGVKALISFALSRMDDDRFTDKTSLSSYEQILTIEERGYVIQDDFIALRMLPDIECMQNCQRINDKHTLERFAENADRFDEIDRAVQSDSISEILSDRYTNKALAELRARKASGRVWHENIDYKSVIDWIKKNPNDMPIELDDDSLRIMSPSSNGALFFENSNYFVKHEGTTKAQHRKRHILICVPDDVTNIQLQYKTSIPMQEAHKRPGYRTRIEKTSTRITIIIDNLERHVTFASATIQRNVLSIAVVKTKPQYLLGIITKYSVSTKAKNEKSSLILDTDDGRFVFNPNASKVIEQRIEQSAAYTCYVDQCLHLCINDDEHDNDQTNLEFTVNCGGCIIPLSVKLERRTVPKLTAGVVYREKLISRRSFQVVSSKKLQLGTREFDVEDKELLDAIDIDSAMLKGGWLSATKKNGKLFEKRLSLPDQIASAYNKLLQSLKRHKTTPTLAFYHDDDDLHTAVTQCIQEVASYVAALQDDADSELFDDLLDIGVVFDSDNHDRILFTPLHPINLAYQLNVPEAGSIINDGEENEQLINIAIAKLGFSQSLPFIHYNEKYYEVSDALDLQEWSCYYPIDSIEGHGIEEIVTKVVRERIQDYLNHFGFMFSSGQRELRIACIDLGNCEGILRGVTEYLLEQYIQNRKLPEDIIRIHIDCYGESTSYTAFEYLLDRKSLEAFITSTGFLASVKDGSAFDECVMLILSHVSFSTLDSSELENAESVRHEHIAFALGASKLEPTQSGVIETQNTGIMLGGALAVTSTTDTNGWFKTGYGTKDAVNSPYLAFLTAYNALYAVCDSPASFSRSKAILAGISHNDERSFDRIYDASNWVVLLDPKADPLHFARTGDDDLLIIHYTDQETTNGYDAITVTKKSRQYEGVIQEALNGVTHGNLDSHVRSVINFANAFNGTWLLSFLDSSGSQMPRSRMSMLAAVKAATSYYHSESIVWVPLSLEEVLRVSGGLKLSATSEINSWKNLGFKNGPTSDDVLLVGITGDHECPHIVLHPVEVKVGNCTPSEINKGVEQAKNTYESFMHSYWGENRKDRLATRIARNSFMQKVLTSAEKLLAYDVMPNERLSWVANDCRRALQNERYEIVISGDVCMLDATVIGFANDASSVEISTIDDVRVIRIPDTRIPDITIDANDLIGTITGHYDYEKTRQSSSLKIHDNSGDQRSASEQPIHESVVQLKPITEDISSSPSSSDTSSIHSDSSTPGEAAKEGIRILFGSNRNTGAPVYWEPCDTNKLFHTNTGIIGTMGTGKTQFTKSMIAQLYAGRSGNPGSADLGILIFDYKGDYNGSQTDFVNATNATVLQPYHLPFNPLSISNAPNSLPLLPKHVANTFKDTLMRACSSSKMGAIQANTLFNCIMSAYALRKIDPANRATWERTPPTFETVYKIYAENEDIKKNDSLASIMDKVHEFEIFESDADETVSLYDLVNGVVVIDLSGYDPDIQNLVVGMTLDLFYSQMHMHGHSALHGNLRELSKFILVDEADNFLSQGFPSLRKILKEGREFGVGTILSTQFLRHFVAKDDDFSKYILTWVVHNVADLDASDIRFVFNTTPKSNEENHLFEEVKRLGKHCSLVRLGDSGGTIALRDKPFWELVLEESRDIQ